MYHHQFVTSTLNPTSTMKLAPKIELTPNQTQREYFAKACGVSRFAYNWALANWNSQYKNWKEAEVEAKENGTINNLPKPNEYELRKQFNAIKSEQYPFVKEITKCAVQQGIKDFLYINQITITILCKKSVLEAVGGFSWHDRAEDLHCWLKMLFAGYKIYRVRKYMAYRRIHQNSWSNGDYDCSKEVIKIIHSFKQKILDNNINYYPNFKIKFYSYYR